MRRTVEPSLAGRGEACASCRRDAGRRADRVGCEAHRPDDVRTKREAEAFLAGVRSISTAASGSTPMPGRSRFASSPRLARTSARAAATDRELYEGQLRLHILPTFGDVELRQLGAAHVRTWHAEMLKAGKPGRVDGGEGYRLLRTILTTAVEDELIVRNPCVIKGAGVERLARAADRDDRAGLRARRRDRAALPGHGAPGDLHRPAARRAARAAPAHLDLLHRTSRSWSSPRSSRTARSSSARRRPTPAAAPSPIPRCSSPTSKSTCAWAAAGNGRLCSPARRPAATAATLYTAWSRARRAVGSNGLRFHDLRHTGNTLAASTGASTKELMSRLGHASPRAALIYQHVTI